jgi:hypothetical protein
MQNRRHLFGGGINFWNKSEAISPIRNASEYFLGSIFVGN